MYLRVTWILFNKPLNIFVINTLSLHFLTPHSKLAVQYLLYFLFESSYILCSSSDVARGVVSIKDCKEKDNAWPDPGVDEVGSSPPLCLMIFLILYSSL